MNEIVGIIKKTNKEIQKVFESDIAYLLFSSSELKDNGRYMKFKSKFTEEEFNIMQKLWRMGIERGLKIENKDVFFKRPIVNYGYMAPLENNTKIKYEYYTATEEDRNYIDD